MLIQDGIIGGPSIVFSRHHKKDKTKLRPTEFLDPKMCKEVLGVSVNALYLWCMMQNMSVGTPKRWKRDNTDYNEFFFAKHSQEQSCARLVELDGVHKQHLYSSRAQQQRGHIVRQKITH